MVTITAAFMRCDVVIIGGGPAGLSAALMLARCRRDVLVIDDRRPRNLRAEEMHGFITRDGINPLQLLRMARAELRRYGVTMIRGRALRAASERGGFRVTTADGTAHRARKLLLATGVVDRLPDIPGLKPCYGRSVHHCPYCDGYEWRDRALAAYGRGRHGAGLALALRRWSDDIVVCTDGPARLRREHRLALDKYGITIDERRLARLRARRGLMTHIVFSDGSSLAREALFFNTGQRQQSSLALMLGCRYDREGGIEVDKRGRTCVPGVYAAGDALRDVQQVICAAADGSQAAIAINVEMQEEEGRTLG